MKKPLLLSAVLAPVIASLALLPSAFAAESAASGADKSVLKAQLEVTHKDSLLNKSSALILSGDVSPFDFNNGSSFYSSSVTPTLNDDGSIDVKVLFTDFSQLSENNDHHAPYFLHTTLSDGEELSSTFGDYAFNLAIEGT
jgi:hypothetical protein